MDLVTIENELAAVLDKCDEWLSQDQIAEWREDTLAGEPGETLETLCSRLLEVDASLPYKLWERLQHLASLAEFVKALGG